MHNFAAIPFRLDQYGGVTEQHCGCGCGMVRQRQVSEKDPSIQKVNADDPQQMWVMTTPPDNAKRDAAVSRSI